MPVSDVLGGGLGAVEYQMWGDHLARYPPGDYLAQSILANIWAALVTGLSGEHRHSHEVAPWLEGVDARAKREAAEAKTKRAQQSAVVSEIYQSRKQANKDD